VKQQGLICYTLFIKEKGNCMRSIVWMILIWAGALLPSMGADLNSTIIHGNATVYNALYKKLASVKESSDEISLQKTLLTKLIKIAKIPKQVDINISSPANQKEYLNLFDTFLDTALKKAQLKSLLRINANKIETLNNQIKDQNKTILTGELFYTLYTKEQELAQKQLTRLQKLQSRIEEMLISAIKHISFDTKTIKKQEEDIIKEQLHLHTQLEQLRIKKERYILLEQSDKVETLQKRMIALQNQIEQYNKKALEIQFLRFSIALQKRDDTAFALHKEMSTSLETKITKGMSISDDLDNLLTQTEKHTLGTLAAVKGKGVQEVQTQLKNLWHIANQPLFTINKTSVSIFKLLISLLIFIFGFIVGSFYKHQIKKLSLRNRTLTSSTRTMLANLGYYIIFIITFFIVLKVLGIDLGSIALVAGALSVGIGFGLQNIISNFVSGIILMVERSVKIGDYIQLDDNLRGHVVDIKMRSITVNTNSNIDVIVPNQDLIQNRVINWTMNDKIRRFEIPFGVAYGTDPQKVIDVVLKAVKESNFNDIYTTQERHTRVIMTGMGDSSVNFELFVWLVGREILYPKRTTSRFLILIYNALYENGIEIPFPQQDLHIKSIETTFPVSLKKESS